MRKTIDAGKVCEHCGSVTEYPKEAVFCDGCKVKIPNDVNYRLTLFWKDADSGMNTDDFEFCSWICLFRWLRTFKLNKQGVNFVTLPYISDDNANGDWGAELTKFIAKFIEASKELQKDE